MNMTKREKILMQILLGVLVVGLMVVYLLLPKMKEHKVLLNTKAEDEATLEEMNEALLQTNVYDELKDAEERIEKISIFFNGIWNSYTVDGFINQLVTDNNLEIKSLSIGEFQEVSDENFGVSVPFESEDEEDTEESSEIVIEEEDILLSCDVSISAFGRYNDVLALMDQLNKESQAMAITAAHVTIAYDYIPAEGEGIDYVNCSITFKIYGIKPYEKKEVKVDDEQ